MSTEHHWTEGSADAFAHRIAFDFIAQVENRIESLSISQVELARKLGVSEGAVSKLLNNPQNLTLRTIAKYSRALGIKAAIVAYDDGDVTNKMGPVNSEIFTACWERAGKPRDFWSIQVSQLHGAATTERIVVDPQTYQGFGVYGLAGSNWLGLQGLTEPRKLLSIRAWYVPTVERIGPHGTEAIPGGRITFAGTVGA